MKVRVSPIREDEAMRHLMDLLRIPGVSGEEGRVAAAIRQKLEAAGVPSGAITHDRAPERIRRRFGDDAPRFEVGNLIVRLPGTRREPRRMGLAHMDTVTLCRDAEPVLKGRYIRPARRTGLGADNRVGVAAWITAIETMLREKISHPPLTIVFTVGEECGLYGAKVLNLAELGRPAVAFNTDSGDPARIVVGAIGANRWEAHVYGLSAHAGMHPERGVSAILIAARAIERAAARGFFGRIEKGRRSGRANVGIIRGGEATNLVTDLIYVRGECRSHDRRFLDRITAEWKRAFEWAVHSVRNVEGRCGHVRFRVTSDYRSFRLSETDVTVRFATSAARAIGLQPKTCVMDGGLDANPLNEMGVPTITFGAGQHGAHSVDEYVDVPEFLAGCRLALELITAPMPAA